MVVLDNHVSLPTWCCSNNDGNGFFGDVNFDPKEWVQGLSIVARTYKDNPAVVAMSMRNELRGARQSEGDWRLYMEEGATTIHRENPNILIIVSGLNFDTNLEFLKTKPFEVNFDDKLVFEAHWYTFSISKEKWIAQSNNICADITQSAKNNYLFLISGNRPFPLFLSEFGIDQRGVNEADNRYISCLLATVAEYDIDWALWALQGSYILREGEANHDEAYGILDINWDNVKNPSFLEKLQLITQINQDVKPNHPTYYLLYHPLSGQCTKIGKTVYLTNCKTASRFDQHEDGGPIKLAGASQCLGVVDEGVGAQASNDCSSMWRSVSSSRLHLAAPRGQGKFLCLEKNDADSTIVTKKCLCIGDNLQNAPNCPQNPEIQWFKLVPANV
ncbi:uncharacterized protein LOC111392407 isoform X5 [Olea europaea var. sylvestris]|nr:uncharacterized protein LOC111392407 isoform X5 [Olea europaea var. sylvestris]XP_022873526.1 uncharacterized protein LOC111392407 isoform X5 [Olea europaea var. sylvestris]XP_022873527.1 uncharacterized protein LOC111392407 isoform X5 [Olea europaea var. sylvestris]XP_022873528.1 uncharacterized protein LOC111392407 isoform X5 [Olea europaea var. sylvestris]